MRRVLRQAARQNRRTVTQQINFVLQEWIKRDYPPKDKVPSFASAGDDPQYVEVDMRVKK